MQAKLSRGIVLSEAGRGVACKRWQRKGDRGAEKARREAWGYWVRRAGLAPNESQPSKATLTE